MKSGTAMLVDSEGNQTPLSLAGTGIAQAGLVIATTGTLNFGYAAVGSTSSALSFNVNNIGNVPATVTAFSSTGDFVASSVYCKPPYNINPGTGCGPYYVQFAPTKVSNTETGSFLLTTSVGQTTVGLTGISVAASKAIALAPPTTASFDFGNVQVGQTVGTTVQPHQVNVTNIGSDPLTISGPPVIGGANASDFGLTTTNGDDACISQTLNPGVTCVAFLEFHPSAAGTRTATLTFTDNASTGNGTQTVTLTGVGTAAQPTYSIVPNTLTFPSQPVSTMSGGSGLFSNTDLTFFNNTASPVTISTVTFSPAGIFTRYTGAYNGSCTQGSVAANGGHCFVIVYFAPTAAGPVSGTATMTDSNGKTYVANLYGYATPVSDYVYVNPVGLQFAPQPQLSASAAQLFTLTNQSTLAVAVGQATISSTNFKIGSDGCSNRSLTARGGSCQISGVVLAPTAATTVGAHSATITIPVTYGDGKPGTYTVALTGTVVAPINSAELSPTVVTFLDQAVNTTSGLQNVTITNKSNEAFTISALTSTNIASTGPFAITNGSCNSVTLNPGASCLESIVFKPTASGTGVRGTLTFPITFTNGKTTSLTATYSGNALAAKSSLLITPSSANLGPEVVGQAYGGQVFIVTNNGNQPVAVNITLSSTQAGTNFTRNGYGYNQCYVGAGTLNPGASCPVFVEFAPQTTGTINGTLTIGDSAASGGPHNIPLVGVGVAATRTIGVSQSSVNFGDVTVGGSGPQEAIYLTNQSAGLVGSFTYTLGGTNASDFTLKNNTCAASIVAKQTCALLVSFNPATASLGARSSTVTVAFGGSTGASIGSPITINLQGNGVPPAPTVALFPSSLSYPTQAVGSKSAPQYFRLYNTGSASLKVTAFGDTTTEFSITSTTCSGTTLTLTAGQSCLIGVAFSPSAAGPRSGSVQFTDNANNVVGSKQAVTLTGVAVAVPLVTLSPSSLAFGNQNVGTTSPTQTVTVTNAGAATLTISGIAKGGSSPGDFAIATNTCGSTLASKATCTITVQFAPMVSGARTASIVLSDNADNSSGVAQPTQTISLGGTGVGVPSATIAPSSINFGSGTVGTPTTAMTVTLKNSGTGALAIASIGLTGTNSADFSYTSGCGTSLAAGAQCSITVVFDAKAAGARTANLVVTDNSGLVTGSTQIASLSGTGAS